MGEGLVVIERDGHRTDHTEALNSAVWGFLVNCIGIGTEAEVMFRQAKQCNGLDA